MTATLSWLSLALINPKHAKPSRSPISIAWKSVEGGAQILARVVVTYVLAYCVVLDCTSTDSHSSHTVVNVQAVLF